MIKAKDPKIYNKETTFFSESTAEHRRKQKEKKPVRIKDYIRERVLEKAVGGDGLDDGDFSDDDGPQQSYSSKQANLKQDFLASVKAMDGGDDSDEELFTIRKESAPKPNSLKEALKDAAPSMPVSEASTLQRLFSHAPEDENEKFLRDYVLNRKWVDDDTNSFSARYMYTGVPLLSLIIIFFSSSVLCNGLGWRR